MTTEVFNFDISEHLETDEDIREFLKETSNTGDTSDLIFSSYPGSSSLML